MNEATPYLRERAKYYEALAALPKVWVQDKTIEKFNCEDCHSEFVAYEAFSKQCFNCKGHRMTAIHWNTPLTENQTKMTSPFDHNDKPTPEMLAKMDELRADFKALAGKISEINRLSGFVILGEGVKVEDPSSQEKQYALKALQEAAMFANKAITHSGE